MQPPSSLSFVVTQLTNCRTRNRNRRPLFKGDNVDGSKLVILRNRFQHSAPARLDCHVFVHQTARDNTVSSHKIAKTRQTRFGNQITRLSVRMPLCIPRGGIADIEMHQGTADRTHYVRHGSWHTQSEDIPAISLGFSDQHSNTRDINNCGLSRLNQSAVPGPYSSTFSAANVIGPTLFTPPLTFTLYDLSRYPAFSCQIRKV